ncbi:MAG: hypothetical protein SF069_13230 [Phycisphaerae bacterium]|nr:hypothetical protein [Phycisphaerae bacterium]
MIVTLNGERLDRPLRGDSLAALLEDISAACPEDELITSIAVDGIILDEATLTDRMPHPVSPKVQLDFQSGKRGRVVADALRSVAEQLSAAADDQRWAAERLDGGDVAGAVREVGEFVKIWQTCQQTISQASSLLGIDLAQQAVGESTIAARLESLANQLRALRETLIARDTVLLGDRLRCEAPELCDDWSATLYELADQAEAGALVRS